MIDSKDCSKSSDSHKTFRVYCDTCLSDCGYKRLREIKDVHRCRSCSAKHKGIVHLNESTVRLKANLSRRRRSNVNYEDYIIGDNSKRKYRTYCPKCNKDLGYQLSRSTRQCRACYLESRKSQISQGHKDIRKALKSHIYHRLCKRSINKGRNSIVKFLRFTIKELYDSIESKFKDGMTWDNYGTWHIDHIIPDSWFNYTSIDDPEFHKSWSLDNLQPLWAEENRKKSNKYAG